MLNTSQKGPRNLSRRAFVTSLGMLAVSAGCQKPRHAAGHGELDRMIVLGIDGMDPKLVQQFVAQGRLPNCRRLIERGTFRPLQTSNPPQSPVAWSNFVSGTNPGGHGIFDFVARDPQTMQLYHSVARSTGTQRSLTFGSRRLPLSSAAPTNLRRGPTLWETLTQHGVDCTVFRIPANFPPTASEARTLSGMGTPDLLGGYGSFSFFSDADKTRTKDVPGGRIERVDVSDGQVTCRLRGPVNEFLTSQDVVEVPIQISVDPRDAVAKIVIQDKTLILQQNEWSDWIVVRFRLVPWAAEVTGICRLYLQSVREPFALYVTPININPADPSVPISTPPDYSRELVRDLGYFYTQGIVEDTQALSSGVLTADEYRQQALFVHDERLRFYKHELGRFRRGFLFFYFSTLDLNSHMFWRAIDSGHPQHSTELARGHGDFIATLYDRVDQAIGQALEQLDERDSLLVISDHGFTSFRRQFNLNSWLLDNGYLRTRGPAQRAGSSGFADVEWGRSRAYGVGLNGLYLNRQSREADGIVQADEADRLADELIQQLQAIRDPESGAQVIDQVVRANKDYSGPYVDDAPDLIVGYRPNYRASWDTVLGGFPRQHLLDNLDPWSGDHCVAPSFVPGVLLSNHTLTADNPRLEDLAPTILDRFGAVSPKEMTGRILS